MDIVNTTLLKHPMNWLTIMAMVFLTGILIHLGLRHWNNN